MGVLDVVPFVALGATPFRLAAEARDAFCTWAGAALELPCFRYGPLDDGTERTLPELRRGAFTSLAPDAGPPAPHRTAGAAAVGARGPLVAYNLWLAGQGPLGPLARSVAAAVRGPSVRALGFELAHGVQVSCNLVDPWLVGPSEIYDAVAAQLEGTGASIARCELVGLVPASVLDRVPPGRWEVLGLAGDRTIEWRIGAATAVS